MKKKLFMTIMMGACVYGLFMGGAMPLTEIPYEIVTR